MKFISRLIFICFIIFSAPILAQSKDSTDVSGFSVFGYPYAFYTPETNFAFGAGGLVYFRTDKIPKLNLSSVLASFYYTINNQYDITLTPELYFADNDYILKGNFSFGNSIDKFYGVGSAVPEISAPDYLTQYFTVNLNAQIKISGQLETGIIYDFFNSKISDKKENPFLNGKNILGGDGGISSGLGAKIVYDSRDYIYLPTSGGYYEISAVFYGNELAGDFNFSDYLVDLRKYFSISDGHLLTFQLYGNFMTGNPPFYELPRLGGSTTMRGYYFGRYRDKNYFSAQTEIKNWFWEEFNLGIVFFAGLGDVAGKFSDFKLTQLQYSYGFGLRYIFDEKERLTVRADFGFGKNTNGIYFAMQESF